MGDEHMNEREILINTQVGDDTEATGKADDDQSKHPAAQAGQDPSQNLGSRLNEVADLIAHVVEEERNDSEAETVVLQGKERDENTKEFKKIKLEDEGSEYEESQSDASNRIRSGAERRTRDSGQRPHLKRKRGDAVPKYDSILNGHESSELSSNASSPAPKAHSSKTSESRASSLNGDDDGTSGKPRKKLTRSDGKQHQRGRSNTAASIDSTDARMRGVLSKHTSKDRRSQHSQSPQPAKSRVRSTHSNKTTLKLKQRRKPAPLNVEQRSKQSEDVQAESDESSSVQSHHRSRKARSHDVHAMSPAKIPVKKNRDRSGQTALARVCRKEDAKVEDVERLLREHPEDINVPDYAGNTPLQFASLAGNDAVVQLLLQNNCDKTCYNVDRDTPLIDAIENSNLGVVKLLLDAGVNPRIRNGQGVEPVDLVDLDEDDGQAIRELLLKARKAKANDPLRRQSEDQRHGLGRDTDTPSAQASGASPTESTTRSPPPLPVDTNRKRTARSQQSDDALLWVNPTPDRLRTEAGKGNLKFVAHILSMKDTAETGAILAAVKGGHEEVLGVMFALAATEADPEPLPDEKLGQNTPMLAAIGRGNLDVIKLLLNQAGFDPTRRVYKNMTYPEISRERRGEFWEEERDILQKALEEHRRTGGHRSNTNSPRRVRKQRPHPPSELSEPSSPPQSHQKVRKTFPLAKQDPDTETKRVPSYQGTAAKQRGSEKGGLDKAHARSTHSTVKLNDRPKSAGHDSSRPLPNDHIKPKRKLMSGNDLKSSSEVKKKAKMIDDVQPETNHNSVKLKHRQSISSTTIHQDDESERHLSTSKHKKASSEEPTLSKDSINSKKRIRTSASPQATKTEKTDATKKTKRPRVGSLGASKDINAQKLAESKDAVVSPPPSAAKIASPSQGAAPVAFMGGSTTIPVMSSPTQEKDLYLKANDIAQTMTAGTSEPLANRTSEAEASVSSKDHDMKSNEIDDSQLRAERAREEKAKREQEAQREQEAKREREAKREQDARREEEAKREREAARKREEDERETRLKQEAEDAKRMALEAERQAQLERDAEEARIARVKREEELQRRRIEEERLKREEQERKRKEREEREALRRRQQLEEEKRARVQALPNGLRRAAELSPEEARQTKEIIRWLPLRTANTSDINAGATDEAIDEPWISNVQAAPILANQDLELSQCKYFKFAILEI